MIGVLLGAFNQLLASLGLSFADESGRFYGDALAAVAALSLVGLGAVTGLLLHTVQRTAWGSTLSMLCALLVFLELPLRLRTSMAPSACELLGGPYGYVAIMLGFLVWLVAAVCMASLAHLLRPGGGP